MYIYIYRAPLQHIEHQAKHINLYHQQHHVYSYNQPHRHKPKLGVLGAISFKVDVFLSSILLLSLTNFFFVLLRNEDLTSTFMLNGISTRSKENSNSSIETGIRTPPDESHRDKLALGVSHQLISSHPRYHHHHYCHHYSHSMGINGKQKGSWGGNTPYPPNRTK